MTQRSSSIPSQWTGYENALRATDSVIRQHSKTFFFATALLPTMQRQAIRALYAFCRASDDLVDCDATRLEDFISWQAEVSRPASSQRNPLLAAWAHVREIYQVDQRYERELLEGIRMDLQFKPFATWADLQAYCYLVASTVGLLSMPIIGLASGATLEQANPAAIQLGAALQLTNILRDVGEDMRRGRIYLPLEDLDRFGLGLRDIQNEVYDARFIGLMQFEIARARSLYQAALPGIKFLNPRARIAVCAAALLYERILSEIEAIEYQVYRQRAYTTAWQKAALLPHILLTLLRL